MEYICSGPLLSVIYQKDSTTPLKTLLVNDAQLGFLVFWTLCYSRLLTLQRNELDEAVQTSHA